VLWEERRIEQTLRVVAAERLKKLYDTT